MCIFAYMHREWMAAGEQAMQVREAGWSSSKQEVMERHKHDGTLEQLGG